MQWRSTQDVLNWFKKIKCKGRKHFIKFDIEAFYPSITRKALLQAVDFAKRLTDISKDEVDIITNSCKTVLYYDGSIWIKNDNPDTFDIPMGSLHGAEICELIGLYILDKMKNIVQSGAYGLYRDDGLMVVRKSGSEMERLCKCSDLYSRKTALG